MPRKRTIAPGYFLNEELCECPPLARLLFAGLWCWADRLGRLEDRPRRIKGQILPYDEADGEALIAELTSRGLLERYEVDGTRVIQIVHFETYQDPHPRETPSILPNKPGKTEGEPKADLLSAKVPPRLARPSCPSRPSNPSARSARGDGRAGEEVTLGSLGSEVVAKVSEGLGTVLLPLKSQDEADEFEARVERQGGASEAVAYFASTCRSRDTAPEGVKLLLIWLRDLQPEALHDTG